MIDTVPLTIRKEDEIVSERHISVRLLVLNALDVPRLNRTFDTVIDPGSPHVRVIA